MIPLNLTRQDADSPQYRGLRKAHEDFARELGDALSAFLQTELKVQFDKISFVGAADFRQTLRAPSCMITLQLAPLADTAIIAFDSTTVFYLLELLLGGQSGVGPTEPRTLTEIEWSLLEEVVRIIAAGLGEAWKAFHEVEFQVKSLESDPALMAAGNPAQRLSELAFTIQFGEKPGGFRVAVPQTFFESVPVLMEPAALPPPSEDFTRNAALLADAQVEVEVVLTGPTIPFQDIANLEAGQVVRFEYPLRKPLQAVVNGTVPLACQLTNAGKKRAFQIDEAL
jgi:flagellar motor switch protein FliM